MGNTTKYWKGLDELNQSPEFVKSAHNEFAESIPVDQVLNENGDEASGTSRRDFLKFLGFGIGVATLAACETPVTKAIPYVIKPEEITPGIANWYASTFFDGHDYCSILVKTREGRPIKIEGNTLSSITLGGTSARVQASVLSVYDSNRLNGPKMKKGKKWNDVTWSESDKAAKSAFAKASEAGKQIVILSSSIISPSTKSAIAEFIAKYPGAKHVSYDAISASGMLLANKSSFGKAVLPSYDFSKADVVVSFDADFLANWISPVEHAKQFSSRRKVTPKPAAGMSKHFQFETILTVTGSNADVRIPVKPSEQGAAVVALYNKLTGGSLSGGKLSPGVEKGIAETAKALTAAKGKALVVCGSNDANIQFVVNEINNWLGSYGTTIDINTPSFLRQGIDQDFATLVKDMNDGKVGALVVYNANPLFTAPPVVDSVKVKEAFTKVDFRVSFNEKLDETGEIMNYLCPDHNFLESWNDHEPKAGHFSLQQPAITPVYASPRYIGTRSAQESILKWSGNNTDYYSYIRQNWEKKMGGMDFKSYWNQTLHDGIATTSGVASSNAQPDAPKVTEGASVQEDAVGSKITIEAASSAISSIKGSALELVVYEKTGIGNGVQAYNPWLQELPDPISRVTWDNYITMNPADMQGKFDLLERFDQIEHAPDTATVSYNGYEVTLPVIPQPGQAKGTIAIALGYGSEKSVKLVVGKNAYPFLVYSNGSFSRFNPQIKMSEKKDKYQIACTQTHHTMMGRDIVHETIWTEFDKNEGSGNNPKELHTHKGIMPVEEMNLWDSHDRPLHQWAMAIDLNTCIGCGACVVACNVENNVHVVGKEEVRRSREMHWIRIDRYYSSDMNFEKAEKDGVGKIDMYRQMENPAFVNPKVVFQPIMCQHCNHAPCETVCPVLATSHSNDGLNMMTYNRCVGTRYCANNCPYKVRRFNWFQYDTYKSFKDVNPAADDLGKMVLNPDVVVRSRGVMEKCSMCIQRIQDGRLTAKKESRKIKDGEIITACAQACPTDAIIFGDLHDQTSMIRKYYDSKRKYDLLEEVEAQPSVFYMTKVRNTDELPEGFEAPAKEGHKEDKKEHA